MINPQEKGQDRSMYSSIYRVTYRTKATSAGPPAIATAKFSLCRDAVTRVHQIHSRLANDEQVMSGFHADQNK